MGTLLFCLNLAGCHARDLVGDSVPSGDPDTDTDVDSGVDGDAGPDCDPTSISLINAETSAVISTVGIVEWSTSMVPVLSASVEFGLDTNYGYIAPADLNAPNYRTLLLGMKPSRTYHYRIVVNDCVGSDYTIDTGSQPTNLPVKNISVMDAASSAGGFVVASTGGLTSRYAYILDADGDYVWWYAFNAGDAGERMDGISRAKMSADGKFMWAGTTNVGCGCGYLFRIPMDGLGTQEIIAVDRHHDFTVLPDNTVATIAYSDNGDKIVERGESGQTRTVYNLSNDFAGEGMYWSHCNAIHYYQRDDSYSVSCLGLNNIIKVDRASGLLLWRLEGDSGGDFTGVSWNGQHGHQLLDDGNMLIFSNGGDSGEFGNGSAEVMELKLDLGLGSGGKVWNYIGGPGSAALGDVQRISKGNTLVTYSLAGEIHEVSSSKVLLRSIAVDGLGYADWRPSLYGDPFRY